MRIGTSFELLAFGAVAWSVGVTLPMLVGENKATSSAVGGATGAIHSPIVRLRTTGDNLVWVENNRSEIVMLDLDSKKKDRNYLKHAGHVDHWAVSRDGVTFLASIGERYLEICRDQEMIVAEDFPGDATILSALSSDGQTAIRITDGKYARSWDLSTSSPTFNDFEIENRVNKIALDSSGHRLATSTRERLEIYDLKKGSCVAQFPVSEILTPQFSDDGQWLVLRSTQSLQVCDAQTFECRWTLKVDMPDVIEGLAISPDSKLIAAKTLYAGLRVFDSTFGECRYTLMTSGSSCRRIDFTPSGNGLCYSDEANSIWVWTFADNQRKKFR